MNNLVLLHGWGLNAKVWSCISSQLEQHFYLHLINLPGYDNSNNNECFTLIQIAETIVHQIPNKSLLLGWSLGGLVATQLAYLWPEKIIGLITVAFSPCFYAIEEWPGINLQILKNFSNQLNVNVRRTMTKFISLQTINTPSAYRDACWLKKIVCSQHDLSLNVLNLGIKLLSSTDLRHVYGKINLPMLRIYGKLDILVPITIVSLMEKISISNYPSIIFSKAAHVPFLSHTNSFVHELLLFNASLN